MHDSNKDQDTFEDDLDEFDEEFDDDFDLEEEWDDEDDLAEDLIVEEQQPQEMAPSPDNNASDNSGESQALQNEPEQVVKADKSSDPDHFPKKKKKRSLTFFVAIIVVILAVGLTAYNTLRPSLSPTLLPVIKLSGTEVAPNDGGFVDDAQKRIDEIMEAKKTEQGAKDDLMKPFEGENVAQDALPLSDQITNDNSVLTPLPTNFEGNSDELPSLEKALESVSMRNDNNSTMEISENGGLLDDEDIANPFSGDNSVESAVDTASPFASMQTESDDEMVDTLELEKSEAAALEKEKAEERERIAAEEEALKAAQEAQARAEAEEAARIAKLEAEKQAKIEAARKKEQVAAKKAAASTVKAQKTVTPPPPRWEIRGIRTDRAVLYDKNSGDIEAVEVGSKVRGLGRVKEISKKNGHWVILGSEGSVGQ